MTLFDRTTFGILALFALAMLAGGLLAKIQT